MSQFLNLKFDEDSADKLKLHGDYTEEKSDESIILADGPTRNICFVIDNTRRVFLNYSYLVSGEYLPEENKITLTFTTCNIVILGVNLEPFYYHLMDNIVRMVLAVDYRYNALVDNKPVANKIETKVNPN